LLSLFWWVWGELGLALPGHSLCLLQPYEPTKTYHHTTSVVDNLDIAMATQNQRSSWRLESHFIWSKLIEQTGMIGLATSLSHMWLIVPLFYSNPYNFTAVSVAANLYWTCILYFPKCTVMYCMSRNSIAIIVWLIVLYRKYEMYKRHLDRCQFTFFSCHC